LGETDVALVAHLGMSGQLIVSPNDVEDQTHLRIRFSFTDGGRDLRFIDQRTFGWMGVEPLTRDVLGRAIPTSVAHIALDPFDPAYDPDRVVTLVRARRTEIKRALLDQTLVSGVGNIYADEALWRAGLHGRRRTDALSATAVRELLEHVRDVMTAALQEGGTSFDSLYVNVNGQSGYFDRSLRAYGREGEPCERCGTPIRRESFMNRSSFVCPTCQPVPRPRSRASRPGQRRPGG
jgi:formamidopyrimidine-DNA glycosylase